jgi:AraC-like DNA-binding protein
MDWVGFFYGFGVLQGLILAGILLVAPSGHRLANAVMAALVTVIALAALQSWLLRIGYFQQQPGTALLIPQLDFAWGPLLYLYAVSLSNNWIRLPQLSHLLPAVILLLSANLSYWSYSEEQQQAFVRFIWSDRTDTQLLETYSTIISPFWGRWVDLHLHSTLFVMQFALYCAMVLRQISQHNLRLQQHFSSLEHMNLRWLRLLTLGCLAFLVIFLLFNRGQLIMVGHFDVNAPGPSTPSIFLVILIYLIGASAIFQPDLIRGETTPPKGESDNSEKESPSETAPVQETDAPEAESASVPEKYRRSNLSMEDAARFKMQLMEAMQERELYLDCELTLPDLARETGLTPHQVSQVLNGQMNQNFFSFVNNYRIQLAKKLLSGPETSSMPIVELAVEVGFKSKSSFYDAFKKATEMTPTQFKKSISDAN